MTKLSIKEFISQSTYSTIYTPIFYKNSRDIFAYEALSNFVVNGQEVSCIDFFSRLYAKEELFFHLEKKNKQHQINESDTSQKLILHFDIVVFRQKEYRKFWKEYLAEHKNRIIISITHQPILCEDDLQTKEKMMKWLIKHEFEFILNIFHDSVCTLSFEEVSMANYVNIDKSILKRITHNSAYKKLLDSIILFAQESSTKTIIKHIDTVNDLEALEQFKFDYLQGNVLIQKG